MLFDFRKAYDSVPHRSLLRKLEDITLHPLLLRWVHSYLSGGTQKVGINIERHLSITNPLSIYSGGSQGSVIGSLLSQHVKKYVHKGKKDTWTRVLEYCRIYQYSSSESLFQMYIFLVRPNLEYASQVWSPYKVGKVNSIEGVQEFALHMHAENSGMQTMRSTAINSSLYQTCSKKEFI